MDLYTEEGSLIINHIGTPDEGILWAVARGALAEIGVADDKFGRLDFHLSVFLYFGLNEILAILLFRAAKVAKILYFAKKPPPCGLPHIAKAIFGEKCASFLINFCYICHLRVLRNLYPLR